MNEISPMRLAPGIHADISEEAYHADPAPEPSASASVLRTLYRLSPEHAREQHPRLNPAWEPGKSTDAKDAGTILHSLLLGSPPRFRVYEFDSWRGKNAEVKDACREGGLIPILGHKMDAIRDVADAIQRRLNRDFPALCEAMADPETLKEATVISRINGVMCRSRVDILPPAKYGFIADLKFTGLDAPPDEYERTVRRGYRFQADLYPRAVKEARGDEPKFRFYACEEESPHGVACYTFGPGAAERNRQRVDGALEIWKACLAANQWPGYPTLIHTIEDEVWEENKDQALALRHSAAASVSAGMIRKVHEISSRIGGPLR